MIPALRYAEWLSTALMLGMAKPLRGVFGEGYNVVAGKLLGDVCGFLVFAAGLKDDFRTKARSLLAQEVPTAAASPPSDAAVASHSTSGIMKTEPTETVQ